MELHGVVGASQGGQRAKRPGPEPFGHLVSSCHGPYVGWGAALARWVILSYTDVVKTAISLPDDLFALATKRAAELGVSRAQLFATALRGFLNDLDASSLVARIDAVAELANADESARLAVDAGHRVLQRGA